MNPCGTSTFNMFEGFTFEYEKTKYDTSCLKNILYHIKEIVLDGDETSFIWVMKWIHNLFTDPANKIGYAILLQSPEQGSGKNIIIDLLVKIIGFKLYYKAMNMEAITCRFNQHLANKLLIHGDELANYSTHRDSDKLKDNITCFQRSIEPKGLEHYNINACERYIFTSNSELPLRVERTDRRFACFRVNDRHRGDKKYFDKLGADIDNVEIQKIFFLWVCDNPEWNSEKFNFSDIPQTALRQELIRGQFENYIDFIIEYVNEDPGIYKKAQFITIKSLFNNYVTWCEAAKQKCTTFQKFAKNLKKLNLEPSRKIINNKNARGYEIEIESLTKLIRESIRDETFSFDDSEEPTETKEQYNNLGKSTKTKEEYDELFSDDDL